MSFASPQPMVRVLDLRQRRVAVPVRQALLAEPLRLQRIIAMRQPRIGGAHRRHQRIDHFGLDAVREMPRVGDVLEAAPAVGDFLVLGERVGDQREDAQIVLEGLRQRLRCGTALAHVRVLHQGERRLDRKRLAVDLEAQRADGLVEQAVPGARTGHRLLVEQLLDAILELIRLLLAHVLDPRPVMAERGIGHRGVERRIVEPVEFEREEQQMQRRRRDALLHVAVEFRARRIGGVAGIDEAREGDRAGRADRRAPRSASPPRRASRPRPRRRQVARACPCRPPRTRRMSASARSRSRFTSGASIAG